MKGNARFTERETGQEGLIHMVQLTIDDIAVDVPEGTLVLEVALAQGIRSEEHTSELQSQAYLVCRLLLEKKNQKQK